MKPFLPLTLVLVASLSPGLTRAEETPTKPSAEERTYELFQQYLKTRDWQMAEVVAHGAIGKFGPESVLIANMRSRVETAVEGNLNLLHRFDFMPMPKLVAASKPSERRYACVYCVEDLLVTEEGRPAADLGKRLHDLAKEIRQECFAEIDESEFDVAPFDTNLSLVISATQKPHLKALEFIETKRAQSSRAK